jgi:phosphatidylglycerol---prolipoprotein diacylglyceryl transferase
MRPILFKGSGLHVTSYAFFMVLAFVVAHFIRRAEVRRLGYAKEPGHQWVGLGALIGAVLGTKLGMVLFVPAEELQHTFAKAFSLDFSGKTIVGALVLSFLSVEVTKRIVGIKEPTGDGFALAFLAGTGIGRIGCFLNGCCYGSESDGPGAVLMAGALRHPTQIYESVLVLTFACAIALIRRQPRERGRLWRITLLGYAIIRFMLEFVRGDPVRHIGPLTAVQVVCLGAIALLLLALRPKAREAAA